MIGRCKRRRDAGKRNDQRGDAVGMRMASVLQANGRIVHRCARAALAACFFLAAAGFAQGQVQKEGNAKPKIGVACPSQQFKVFLEAFAENPELQRAFIKFPLQYRYVGFNTEKDDYEDMTRIVSSYSELMKDITSAGRFLNRKERKSAKFVMRILQNRTVENPGDMTVMVGVPDSDVAELFYFQRANRCWQLYIIRNDNPPG
jgi:hypothetical protein